MRLGVMAYSTATGLGYQTKAYVKHLQPTKVLVVDLSGYNGMEQNDWYEGAQHVTGYPSGQDMEQFVQDLDVILFAETPLNYNFYTIARQHNVKTACVINWEFFDHILDPDRPLPDLFIMPSNWHWDDAERYALLRGVKIEQIHHPVDRDEIPYTERNQAKFIHIAGRPATNDRNGTWLFLQACPDGIVTTQNDFFAKKIRTRYRHARVITNVRNQAELYQYGTVLVLPRKYGGNCLPMNEALASGMPVIMPDIAPNNNLLPKEWLVSAVQTDTFTPRTKIDIYTTDVQELTKKINDFRAMDMRAESQRANLLADTISWGALSSKYKMALERLL